MLRVNVKKWSGLLKIALSLMLLVIVLSQSNLAELWRSLQGASPGLLGLALLAYLIGVAIRAYRWQLLFRAMGEHISFWRLSELYLVGMFFKQFFADRHGRRCSQNL